jgi:hypothetical protein
MIARLALHLVALGLHSKLILFQFFSCFQIYLFTKLILQYGAAPPKLSVQEKEAHLYWLMRMKMASRP